MSIYNLLQEHLNSVNWDQVLTAEQILIQNIIQKRNIQWLCHFTPRENLENIKKYGLKPRDLLSNAIFTDNSRYDVYNNAICLSISKPNKWMFEKKDEQGFDLCLLLINPIILYKKQCLFYPHNAATKSYRNWTTEQLTGQQALERMFDESITYQKSGKEPQEICRHWNNLLDCETTSDQAEVQCLDIIEPQYIEYIIEENIPLEYSDIREFFIRNLEKERQEHLEKIRKEREEQERLEKIRKVLEEQERLEKIRKEREEQERLEKIRKEREEQERLEKIRKEREEQERLEKIRKEREAQERLEKNRKEREEREHQEKTRKVTKNNDISNYSGGYTSDDDICCCFIIIIILVIIFIL